MLRTAIVSRHSAFTSRTRQRTANAWGRQTSLCRHLRSHINKPRYHVHVHGGAWRDPLLSASTIEATVAHEFKSSGSPIEAIISLNYTISPYPSHPTEPYDPWDGKDPANLKVPAAERDTAREARHPMHIHDALLAFTRLRSIGLKDDSYVLSGHSCGACISFQTVLQPPAYWGLSEVPPPPRPAALVGLNGLYDLQALAHDLGPSHESLATVYQEFQTIAFDEDGGSWFRVSPAQFDRDLLREPVAKGDSSVPSLVVVDQSGNDELVPMNQITRMQQHLMDIRGIRAIVGKMCVGAHAAPWKEGYMIWETVQDVLALLEDA